MEKNFKQVNLKKGKKPRNELQLPILHFIAMDDWVDKLGSKAFLSWLKLMTLVDRSNPNRKNDKITRSLASLAKTLGVGKTTLYDQIIKPLWNYGLIDLEEYSDSKQKTKPMNVIIYESPQNSTPLQTQPLEKVRDYDKDYHSEAKTFANRKKKEPKSEGLPPRPDSGRGTVPDQDGVPSQNRTGYRPDSGHINDSNISFNDSNISFNDSNSSSSNKVGKKKSSHNQNQKKKDDDDDKKRRKLAHSLVKEEIAFLYLRTFLQKKKVPNEDIDRVIILCDKKEIRQFHKKDLEKQWNNVIKELGNGTITNFPKFFTIGLEMILRNKEIEQHHFDQVYQEQAATSTQKKEPFPFYNWLEN